jgi:hypothetical protein
VPSKCYGSFNPEDKAAYSPWVESGWVQESIEVAAKREVPSRREIEISELFIIGVFTKGYWLSEVYLPGFLNVFTQD